MTYKKTNMTGAVATSNRITAIFYSVLIVSSLSTGVLSQLVAGQTGVVNTLATDIDDDYTATGVSKGYDTSNLYATNIASYSAQPVHGQYWTGTTVQYPQTTYQASYPQYAGHLQQTGIQQYPSQYGYGYQPQQYGAYYGQNPGFNSYYWTGSMKKYPVQLPVHKQVAFPVYKPQVPMHMVPVHYPVHPAMQHGRYVKPRNFYSKGFLGGTGSGVVKGVLGAVLAGVVAGKVARGK